MIDICSFAFIHGASDIHVEPQKEGITVRLRIDGQLRIIHRVEECNATLFAEQTKHLFGFNMAIAGVPQDTSWSHPEEPVDCRCNLIPVKYGEKICLRLLERGKNFSLPSYPLDLGAKEDLLRLIKKKAGLIIVSGPTGSGKSTLLYSILGSLDRDQLNIMTVEDPVEYELRGLNQTPINRKKGFGFAEALRALMRQDPDVIMVGEIRDQETAQAAIHAASTGHLVLTTVHAPSPAF
jgi:type II secretory ATPase GspE/PulE/Tfp pilus assembly ATPase PilB-like protein